MKISHFRELEVWRVSMQLAKHVYEITGQFPREERYGLAAQLQRSAVSIPSNIAEGNARNSTRDYTRFVSIAQGSCAELQTQLLLAVELGLGERESTAAALELSERVSQMLLRLQQALSRKLAPGSRVPGPGPRFEHHKSESR